jgi:FixJ family two-component response regulator
MEADQLPKMAHRIAIVDDDAAVRKALMRLLKTSSYDVRTFGRASEFIADLAHGVPACALIDLQMPDMTGLELQQYLVGAGVKIPTIVITAHDEPGSRRRCIAAGAAAYLLKPLRKAALIAAIDAAIEAELPIDAEDLRADDIGPEG